MENYYKKMLILLNLKRIWQNKVKKFPLLAMAQYPIPPQNLKFPTAKRGGG